MSVSSGDYSGNSNQDLWEEARSWFNNMEKNSRNQLILVMYKLCLSTRDESHNKLTDSMNRQWSEKMSRQIELNKELSISKEQLTLLNSQLTKNSESHTVLLSNAIKDLEYSINMSISGLSSKITPSVNGKLGEDYIDHLLSKIPNTSFSNLTQSKGNGDFLFITGNTRIMIESKNWTNSSIKSNPKEIENFKKVAIEAHECGNINIAIMALHRVTDIKGKAISSEAVQTSRGNLILLYVTNLFNHPERILYAIDSGVLLVEQYDKYSVNATTFLYQIDNFLKSTSQLEESIKEKFRIIKTLTDSVKSDSKSVSLIKDSIENIMNSSRLPNPNKDDEENS